MANYTSTENSILGSSYYSGVLNGYEDYVILPVGQDKTVCIVGDIDADNNSYKGDEIIITRSTSGYTTSYDVQYVNNSQGTYTITNEYYCRGNVARLSSIETFQSVPVIGFSTTVIMWGVLLCFVLKPLLSWRSRRV